MIKLKNKKGSHVGMVLSFTIFITAIIFAYAIIGSPFKVSETKSDSINLLEANLINELNEDVIVVRVYDDLNAGSCVQFDTPSYSFSSVDHIAVQPNGTEINSDVSLGKTLITGGKGFVKVYYAERGFDQTLNAPGASCVDIEPKSVSSEKIILEDKIIQTVNRVKDDYDNLTRDLKVSNDDQINISFEYSGETFGVPPMNDLKTDVYVREYQLNYLSKEGQFETGKLRIYLW